MILALLLFGARHLSAAEPTAAVAPDPAVSFDGTVVSAQIAKGGQAVFYAVALVPDGYESFLHRWAKIVPDVDGSGIVRLDIGIPIPCKSVWAVVDLASGQYTLAAPPGCALRTTTLGRNPFKGLATAISSFSHQRPFLDMLYVNPGQGAWVAKAADGEASDGDRKRDHVTTVNLKDLKSLTSDPAPPKTILIGSVLVAIDLYRMDVVAIRVDQKLLQEVLP